MKILYPHLDSLFNIENESDFITQALAVFQFQYQQNIVYRQFVDLLGISPDAVTQVAHIPFLPISFFKTHTINTQPSHELVFKSSGTTGTQRSCHFVADKEVYQRSFLKGFTHFYGDLSRYSVLALLPSYLEQGDSSLVYMAHDFITKTAHNGSGFYINNWEELHQKMTELEKAKKPYLLLGVSYALMDFLEAYPQQMKSGVVMETGGMKGRREELTKTELHDYLKQRSGLSAIHSEYGMTELLSQAYSLGEGKYQTPPWMKVLTRSTTDPLSLVNNQRGLLNIIDLANVYSCSFIATQDLGIVNEDGSFEVLGRFDTSEIRGCNLLVT